MISVLIPVMNEVESLDKTLEIIKLENQGEDFEFIIILSPKSKPHAIENASKHADNSTHIIVQKYPGLGGAYIHGIESSRGDYILMIASDLETDPHNVKDLLIASDENPNSIIATTRWAGQGSGFNGYGSAKLVLNWIFQKFISKLYGQNLTDYTFGYRLYPSASLKNYTWKSKNFGFLLEAILVPVKNGWLAKEIPVSWQARIEEESNNRKSYFFEYFKIAFLIRFSRE